jgi:hypothetical protein
VIGAMGDINGNTEGVDGLCGNGSCM